MMLVDSGSELNIMTMHQAQELALPIDDSGNSWTLKGISGHMMGLEGICWNVPIKIGRIEFSHNFFMTRSSLGNKDMVLGQPWLFSQSTRIDYVHEMGVTLQLCIRKRCLELLEAQRAQKAPRGPGSYEGF